MAEISIASDLLPLPNPAFFTAFHNSQENTPINLHATLNLQVTWPKIALFLFFVVSSPGYEVC